MNLLKFLTPTTSKVFERTLFFNCRKLQYNTITTSTTITILIENSEILLQLLINFPRYIFVTPKIAHENSFRGFSNTWSSPKSMLGLQTFLCQFAIALHFCKKTTFK